MNKRQMKKVLKKIGEGLKYKENTFKKAYAKETKIFLKTDVYIL